MIMEWLEEHQTALAVLVMRLFLGILFVIQGYDKVFSIGVGKVAESFRFELKKGFPPFIYSFTAFFSSWVELLGGLLLLLGLFKPVVAVLLGIDLLMVAVAMSLMNPVWDMRAVFPRLLLLLVIMLAGMRSDVFSLDYLIFIK